jgi:hypothetical protein
MSWDTDTTRDLEPNYGRRMTHAEAVLLCRYAKAACPQQAFDQYTPDAWSDLLGDLRFIDCQEALKSVVQRQPFVSPAEIRAEVRKVRHKRIGDFGPMPDPPSGLSPAESARWQRDIMRSIGDGELAPGLPAEIDKRDVVAELESRGLRVNAIPVDKITSKAEVARQAARLAKSEKVAKPEPEPLVRDEDRSREPVCSHLVGDDMCGLPAPDMTNDHRRPLCAAHAELEESK